VHKDFKCRDVGTKQHPKEVGDTDLDWEGSDFPVEHGKGKNGMDDRSVDGKVPPGLTARDLFQPVSFPLHVFDEGWEDGRKIGTDTSNVGDCPNPPNHVIADCRV